MFFITWCRFLLTMKWIYVVNMIKTVRLIIGSDVGFTSFKRWQSPLSFDKRTGLSSVGSSVNRTFCCCMICILSDYVCSKTLCSFFRLRGKLDAVTSIFYIVKTHQMKGKCSVVVEFVVLYRHLYIDHSII